MNAALITGACINTGVAIVEKFAAEGKNVVFTGRSMEKVRAAEETYRKQFPNVTILGYAIDSLLDERTVDEKSVDELFEELDAKGIFIDSLVLNAADQGLGMQIFESPLTDLMRVINTNVVWNFCLAEHAARRMKENGGGSIVFLNSNTAYRAIPDRVAYVASKGGQLGLMRALALDLGKYNIRVNAVLPGMIKTDILKTIPEDIMKMKIASVPANRVGQPSEIASVASFLASDDSSWVTGNTILACGGLKMRG